jgi:hypothetical protein
MFDDDVDIFGSERPELEGRELHGLLGAFRDPGLVILCDVHINLAFFDFDLRSAAYLRGGPAGSHWFSVVTMPPGGGVVLQVTLRG